ncbi:hypothetical protein G7085_16380 [Tessaracoccus sp. HDW20]|uniref:hypothetical protein n=1 Tax=Tessaracoccus coleopterorum TaxID=2714950 RepID=UPI0018D3BE16|nr:hypothetical protein [Tessaracoccus coleopterorum]NHB85639.1 hypothetical protein [Tessaracoccus coleopterorum]
MTEASADGDIDASAVTTDPCPQLTVFPEGVGEGPGNGGAVGIDKSWSDSSVGERTQGQSTTVLKWGAYRSNLKQVTVSDEVAPPLARSPARCSTASIWSTSGSDPTR